MREVIDCAIIGAGVAGTYCAWRLVQKDPTPSVHLFECTNRIGGRLLSVKIEGIDSKVELGGMRYSQKHEHFSKLVNDLHLRSKSFQMGTKEQNNNNYAYFRGRHLRIRDFSNPEKVPFNLGWSECNKTPNQLLEHVWDLLVPDWNDKKNDPKYWSDVPVLGKPLREYGFWNLLYRVLTPEAFLFLKYGSGYDSNVCNGNAAVLLPTGTEYSSEANGKDDTKNEFRTLTRGMDTLPKTLARRFENICRKKKKGKLEMNLRLTSINRKNGRGNYELGFKVTKTKNGSTFDLEPEEVIKKKAKHVILAMPRAALEKIDWKPLKEKNGRLRRNLDSVLMQEAFKMFLAYKYPWWRSLGLYAGRSLSDLPLRQTFYFGSDGTKAKKTSGKNAVLMASYSDIDSAPFWKGLHMEEQIGRTKTSKNQPKLFKGPRGYKATEMMVREANEQIRQIHDKREIPSPYAAACYFWGHDTIFGGGWHCWKAGYDYLKIWQEMIKPATQENVYICGEAYSPEQGWCEGALLTAEFLLQQLPGKLSLKEQPFVRRIEDWRVEQLTKRSSYRL